MAILASLCRMPVEIHLIIANDLELSDLRSLRLVHSVLASIYVTPTFQCLALSLHPVGFAWRRNIFMRYANSVKEIRFKIGFDAECPRFRDMVSLPRKAASMVIKDGVLKTCETRRRQGVASHTGNRTQRRILAQTLLTIMHIIHTDIKRDISVQAVTIDHTTRSDMDTTAWSHHQSYMAVLTIALLDEFADVFHGQQLRFINLGFVAATYILHHDSLRVDLGLDRPLNYFTPKELRVHFCLKGSDFDHQCQGLLHDLYGIIPRYHPFASAESVQAEVNEGVLIDPPSSQSTQLDWSLLVMITFILTRSARRLELVRFHLSFDITGILVLSSLRYVDTLILRDCYHCAVQGTWSQFFNRVYALKAQAKFCTLTKLKVITSDLFSCSKYQKLYSSSKWIEALGLRDAVLKEVAEGDILPRRRGVFGYAILHILADTWEPDGYTIRARLQSGEDQTAYDRLVALLQQSQPDGTKEVTRARISSSDDEQHANSFN